MNEIPQITLSYMEQRPKEAARVLESLPPGTTAALMEQIPVIICSKVIEKLYLEYAAHMFQKLSPEKKSLFLQEFSTASCIPILRLIPEEELEIIFEHLPTDQTRKFKKQLQYPQNTVGAFMNTDPIKIPEHLTIGEARKYLRRMARKMDYQAFLIKSDGTLTGMIHLGSLAISKDSLPVAKLSIEDFFTLSDRSSLKKAKSLPDWGRFDLLPVTGKRGELIGSLSKTHLNSALFQNQSDSEFDSLLFELVEMYVSTLKQLVVSFLSVPFLKTVK